MTKKVAVNVAAMLAVVFSLFVLMWGFDKGFDMSDGGYYILRYQQDYPAGTSAYSYDHMLVRTIIPESLRSIRALRYIGFGLNLVATIIFALAIALAHKKVHGRIFNPGFICIMLVSGLLLSYTGSPSELSYNSLNQFFLILSCALLLFGMFLSKPYSWMMFALSGISAAFLYLTKVPSGLAMSLLGAVSLFINGRHRYKEILVFWGSGLITLLFLNWIMDPGVIDYYLSVVTASSKSKSTLTSLSSGSGYGPLLLLKSLGKLIIVVLRTSVSSLLIGASFFLYYRYTANGKSKGNLFFALGVLLVILAYSFQIVNHIKGETVLAEFFLLTIFLIAIGPLSRIWPFKYGTVSSTQDIHPLQRYKGLVVLLLAAPFIGAWGTNNPLNWGAKYYYICFSGLITLLYPYIKSKAVKTGLSAMAIYLMIIGLYLYVQHPYRVRTPLYAQTNDYKGIKYDLETYEFLHATEGYLQGNNFKSDQGIIVAYKRPGLAFLMDSHHPGGILWRQSGQGSYFRNLKKEHLKKPPAIIALGDPLGDDFIAGFKDSTSLDIVMDYLPAHQYLWYGNVHAYAYFPETVPRSAGLPK